jgi:hypothetical protein
MSVLVGAALELVPVELVELVLFVPVFTFCPFGEGTPPSVALQASGSKVRSKKGNRERERITMRMIPGALDRRMRSNWPSCCARSEMRWRAKKPSQVTVPHRVDTCPIAENPDSARLLCEQVEARKR